MAVWSTLLRSTGHNLAKNPAFLSKLIVNHAIVNNLQARPMSGTMFITASRWQWHKCKDMFHFYFMVGAIPLGIITLLANIFVGPATLTEIPEGYEPKYWEYFRHPISRFLARYIYNNPQKDYEKNLHMIWMESQIAEIRKLEKKVMALMRDRQDYKWNYFLPYHNIASRDFRELVKRDNDGME